MAFPAPHASTSATFATGGGISLSGVLSGDFLLFVHTAHNFGGATGTITAVSDSVNGAWTQLFDSGDLDDGSNHHSRLSVWYFANSGAGTPSLTVSGTETGGTAYFAAISGAATVSPIRAFATDADGDAVTATLSTAARAGDGIFGAIGGYADGGSTHGVSTAGWTSDYQQNVNNSTSLGVAHLTATASGGETSGVTFSNYPNTPYNSITFLLRSATDTSDYVHSATSSDLTGKKLISTAETASTVDYVVGNVSGYTLSDRWNTEPGVPGLTGSNVGRISVTVKCAVLTGVATPLVRVDIARLNSSGATQATVSGTGQSLPTNNATLQPYTFDFDNPALGTWAAGDRLQVLVYHDHTSLSNRTFRHEVGGTTVKTTVPWTAGVTTVALEAVIAATSTVVAALTDSKLLASALAGDSTVAATLSDGKDLSSTLQGSSSVAASLSVSKTLSAVIAVAATVIFASLTVGVPGSVIRRLRTMLGVGE